MPSWGRLLAHAVIWALGLAYLVPLIVVVLNSLRTAQEIAQTSMIGWPEFWAFGNYAEAWSKFCVAQTCTGLQPFMWNSAAVTIPATIISTLLGAIAGYAISLWRFRGDTWIFGLVTLGIFLPQQMRLIPWTIVLRDIGLMTPRILHRYEKAGLLQYFGGAAAPDLTGDQMLAELDRVA
jgi:glucose/mannose transport system permease protein